MLEFLNIYTPDSLSSPNSFFISSHTTSTHSCSEPA